MSSTTAIATRDVFVTGHTGFKGAWLAEWLASLGAQVTGYALEPPTEPNLFDALDLGVARQARRRRRPRSRPPGGRGAGGAAVGDLPPGRAGARPARVRRAARDLRDERHGHGQRARGGPGLPVGPGGRRRHERQVLRESRDRSRLPWRPTRWAAATRTRPARVRRAGHGGLSRELLRGPARRSPRSAPGTSSAAATGRPTGSSRTPSERWSPASRSSSGTRTPSAPGSTSSSRCPGTCGSAPCCSTMAVATTGPGTSARPEDRADQPVRWVVERFLGGVGAGLVDDAGRAPTGQPHEAQRLSLDSTKAREQLGWAPVWDAPRRPFDGRRPGTASTTGPLRAPATLVEHELEAYQDDARAAGLAWASATRDRSTT